MMFNTIKKKMPSARSQVQMNATLPRPPKNMEHRIVIDLILPNPGDIILSPSIKISWINQDLNLRYFKNNKEKGPISKR